MMMPSFQMQTIFAIYVLNCGRVRNDDANIHLYISNTIGNYVTILLWN